MRRLAIFALALACAPAGSACAGASRATAQAPGVGANAVGWVRAIRVDLDGVRVSLALAHHCRVAPRPREPGASLRAPEINGARCKSEPFEGALPVYGEGRETAGRELAFWLPVTEGELQLSFEDLRAHLAPQLDELRVDPLTRYDRLWLGERGWAGALALDTLRDLLREWHAEWVEGGRGEPALFVLRHPEDPRVLELGALATEARLAREAEDFQRVARGSLAGAAFLRRHVGSPYATAVRRQVEAEAEAERRP